MYNTILIYYIAFYLIFLFLILGFSSYKKTPNGKFEWQLSEGETQYLLLFLIGMPPSHIFFFKLYTFLNFFNDGAFFVLVMLILINLFSVYIYTQILYTISFNNTDRYLSKFDNSVFFYWLCGLWLFNPFLINYIIF